MQNGLDHSLTDNGKHKIKLSSIIPRHAGAVIAVINIADITGPAVDAFEYDSGVSMVPIAVFNMNPHPFIL